MPLGRSAEDQQQRRSRHPHRPGDRRPRDDPGATGRYRRRLRCGPAAGGDGSKRAWQTFAYTWGTQRLETARTYREGIAGDDRYATYHYTDAGTVTSITDTSHDGVDNQCFTYDHLQRLTQAWTQGTGDACASDPTTAVIGGPAPYWQTFTYDTAGNRKTETLHGVGGKTDTTRTYSYADPGHGNRLNKVVQTGGDGDRTDTYGYDDTGNTTTRAIGYSPTNTGQTLEWDTEGELTKVTENGNDETFLYDAEGNRLIRKDPAGTTLYLPDGTELRALNGASTATGTRYYTFADQTVAMRTSDGALTYLTADTQGTAQVAINATNQQATVRRFGPFGNVRGLDDDATWPNDKGFVGGTQDPTGLTNLGARQYDPQTGRFISVDPVMDQADPQQMNGYTYANNNPVTHSDPDGTCPPDICGNGVINVGHDKPATTGGCGHDCGRAPSGFGHLPSRGGSGGHSVGKPINVRWGDQTVHAPSLVAYWTAVFKMQQVVYLKHSGDLGPLDPQLMPECGINSSDNSICGIGDLGRLGNFGKLICQVSHLQCDRMSASEAFGAGMKGWDGSFGRDGGITGIEGIGGMGRGGGVGGLKACSSFVPGTTVLMADGSHKAIEDLKAGDKVQATDPETGETTAEPVLGTITSKGDKNLVQITIDPQDRRPVWSTTQKTKKPGSLLRNAKNSKGGVIIATDTHPFWVGGDLNTWINATDLQPGMWLRTSAGTYVQVTATKHWTTHHQSVHNLTIANLHTYYVEAGATQVLVHNCGGSVPRHRSICDCANGGKPALMRGPKPAGTGPHNLKIAEVADQVTDGQVIAGGGRLPEREFATPGGFKSARRPDVLVQRPDGTLYGINVGKQTARGAPIKREAEALQDLEGIGIPMHFVPYN
ncbi:hypothetical protein F8568_046330 [Actinomadura sp. LD22]|uniref:Hint domain-containing protein n=1 Tax=Actinomadura physcomitrii TaxID=2650748 RepID=A0A6I4MN95_9ACTN|nr:RHS repeat-associated core domain-containing protein [Actinomadura physcomitrii]MWA07608.1 hypothetical protein [Actinomadura physcomitrii]